MLKNVTKNLNTGRRNRKEPKMQNELLQMRSKIFKIKNILDGTNSRLDTEENKSVSLKTQLKIEHEKKNEKEITR